MDLPKLSTLICFKNLENTKCAYFLTQKQMDFLADQVNCLILEMIGLSKESILEKILKTQKLINYTTNLIKDSPGEEISIKINQ